MTTISVSREIKGRLDGLRGGMTYDQFFEDLLRAFSPEVKRRLNLLRRPGETYGSVLARILLPRVRDPGELEGFLEQARLFRRTGKIRVIKKGGEVEVIVEPWR